MIEILKDRVALVTGGGSGIGRATSLAFARAGARVVIADNNPIKGTETKELIGDTSTFIQSDISVACQVEFLIEETVRIYGRLDCAYNNAAIEGVIAPLHKYPEKVWNHVLEINLKGVWLCMKYELQQMLQQGSGAIVNASSTAGLSGSQGQMGAYQVSKHGVVGLTKTAAAEYASKGIRVNALCPGATNTPMSDRIIDSDPVRLQRLKNAIPMGRFATPDEISKVTVWLCSDAALFINGIALPIDGGYLAQ